MTPVTVLNEKTLAVQVPEGSSGWMVSNAQCDNDLVFLKDGHYKHLTSLPGEIGCWKILGRPEEMTEEQWKQVVSEFQGGFTGQMKGYQDYLTIGLDVAPFSTSIRSGHSLLVSKQINPSSVIILIKKQ